MADMRPNGGPISSLALFTRVPSSADALSAIPVAYLYYGILQEELYRPAADGTKFEYSSFLLFVTCICNIVVAMLGVAVTDGGAASFLRRFVTVSAPVIELC